MMGVIWWFIGWSIATAIHEAGHLACGIVASIPVSLLSVGVGPLLLRGRLGNIRLELRLLPFVGFVLLAPRTHVSKPRLILAMLGGVFGNAVMIVLIAALDYGVGSKLPTAIHDGFGPIVFCQLYTIVTNLLPFRSKINGKRYASDGLQLLKILWSGNAVKHV
jgi:membrane-associated protease RseP (regulator of RpoE activity)